MKSETLLAAQPSAFVKLRDRFRALHEGRIVRRKKFSLREWVRKSRSLGVGGCYTGHQPQDSFLGGLLAGEFSCDPAVAHHKNSR